MERKPVVMLHFIMQNQIGGPNIGRRKIMESWLKEKYDFKILDQDKVAGGKISFSLIKELADKIRAINPDILHVTGLQSSGFHCMLAGKLAGCKRIVLSVHGFSGDAIELSPIKRWVFNHIAEPLTLRLANAVYCVCQYATKRPMIQRFARNLKGYVYNVIPEITEEYNRELNRKSLGFNPDDIAVVTISRVTIDKGYQELTATIRELSTIPKIKFIIVGDGNYLNELKQVMTQDEQEGRVKFLGKCDDVLRILSATDIFVFPTLHENLSNALLEASIMGNTVIATNVGGNPEVVIHGETGILIPAGNVQALTEAITYLSSNPDERKRLSDNGIRRTKEIFSPGCALKKLDEIYQSLLK